MRDEGMHMKAGCNIHNILQRRCSERVARAIVTSAVDIECLFLQSILSDDMVGLTVDEMSQYVRYCADHLCTMLVLDSGAKMAPIYGVQNPFTWMPMQSLRPKANFFEAHEGSYVFTQSSPSAAPRASVFEEDI